MFGVRYSVFGVRGPLAAQPSPPQFTFSSPFSCMPIAESPGLHVACTRRSLALLPHVHMHGIPRVKPLNTMAQFVSELEICT